MIEPLLIESTVSETVKPHRTGRGSSPLEGMTAIETVEALIARCPGSKFIPLQAESKFPLAGSNGYLGATDQLPILSEDINWNGNNYGWVFGGNPYFALDVDTKGKYRGATNLCKFLDIHEDEMSEQLAVNALIEYFETLIIETPSRGIHIILRHDLDRIVEWSKTPEDIDFRGAKGYLVGPNCCTTAAYNELGEITRYEGTYTVIKDRPVALAPAAIVKALNVVAELPASKILRFKPHKNMDSLEIVKKATLWLKKRRPAIQGQRGDHNTVLTARFLYDLGLSQDMALELMLKHWNDHCNPPWSEEGLEVKVFSAYKTSVSQGRIHGWRITADEQSFSMRNAAVLPSLKTDEFEDTDTINGFPAGQRINGTRESMLTPWNIYNMLPAGVPGIVFGDEMDGKSFFTVFEAVSLALDNVKFAGVKRAGSPAYKVRRHGCVLYFAPEGVEDIKKRVREQIKHMAPDVDPADVPIYVYEVAPTLTSKAAIDKALETIRQDIGGLSVVAIYIDTAQYAMDGDDSENENSDVSKLYKGARYLIRCLSTKRTVTLMPTGKTREIEIKPSCTLVRHVGHGEKNRVRGAKDWESSSEYRYKVKAWLKGQTLSATGQLVDYPVVIEVSNLKLKGHGIQPAIYFKTTVVRWEVDDIDEETGETIKIPESTLVLTPVMKEEANELSASPGVSRPTNTPARVTEVDERHINILKDTLAKLTPGVEANIGAVVRLAVTKCGLARKESFRSWLRRIFEEGKDNKPTLRVLSIRKDFFGAYAWTAKHGPIFYSRPATDRADEDF